MIKSNQVIADVFVCKDGTGALATPSVGPVGTLYVNGVADAAVVTITGTNPYKFSVTLPALTPGDLVSMYITATIAAIATADFVWHDVGDTALVSDVVTLIGTPTDGTIATDIVNLAAALGESENTDVAGDIQALLDQLGKPLSDDLAVQVQAILEIVTSETGEIPIALDEIKDAIEESPSLWGVIRPR